MKILIATKNPGKIEGAKQALEKYFSNNQIEIVGIAVSSDVPEQPVNEDIYLGAKNRVKNLKEYATKNNIKADMYFAIESGISNQLGSWAIINYAVIEDNFGYQSFGTGPVFPVPNKYVEEIISSSLGTVMDNLFNAHGLNTKQGGINYLTNKAITRIDITKDAFVMALTQFTNTFWKD